MITTVDFEAGYRLLQTKKDLLLVVVREEEEYTTGHAENAVLFTLDTISAESAAALIPDLAAPVMVYCRTGRRSREAARRLDALGYTEIYDLGGLIGWPYGLE